MLLKSLSLALLGYYLVHAVPLQDNGRIIGGIDAPEGFAPYQVSLQLEGFGHFGAAVIYNERWLVTAGHCLEGVTPDQMLLYVGSNKLSTGGVYYKPSLFIQYPNFTFEEFYKNDIGLIKTEIPIVFNDKVGPIKLSPIRPPDGANTVQTGWGSIVEGRANVTVPDNLQLLTANHISLELCEEISKENPWFHESQICTLQGWGRGSCYGDSGGPIVWNDQLIGVTSYGYNETCAEGWPNYNACVPYFYDWLLETIAENS